ncbi:MAG TPA: TIR domain-containing protein [Acidobacteriaceae bacterium]|nr:TIR domain-containing protein [Acidobacteriaceae bacterium]
MPKYDLAISFAGEQRTLAEEFADRLDSSGYSIFYDEYEGADIWGTDLTIKLANVYSEQARFCLVIVSDDYIRKSWTNLERQNALSRFMREKQGYLLCLRTDEAKLPGLPDVIAYVDLKGRTIDTIYRMILQKLGPPQARVPNDQISASDRQVAREIIRACNRRALFAASRSELDLDAMYSSLGEAIGTINSLMPQLRDHGLQIDSLQLVAAIDEIQRFQIQNRERTACCLPPEKQREMDKRKLQAIAIIRRIRRIASVDIQLPTELRLDHFFGRENADEPPLP